MGRRWQLDAAGRVTGAHFTWSTGEGAKSVSYILFGTAFDEADALFPLSFDAVYRVTAKYVCMELSTSAGCLYTSPLSARRGTSLPVYSVVRLRGTSTSPDDANKHLCALATCNDMASLAQNGYLLCGATAPRRTTFEYLTRNVGNVSLRNAIKEILDGTASHCDVRRIAYDVAQRVTPYLGVPRYETELPVFHELLVKVDRLRRRVQSLGTQVDLCQKKVSDVFKPFNGGVGKHVVNILWGPPRGADFAYWRGPLSDAPPGPVRVVVGNQLAETVYLVNATHVVERQCNVTQAPWLFEVGSQPNPATLVEAYSMTADGERIAVPLNVSRFFLSRLSGVFLDGDAEWDDPTLLSALALADKVWLLVKDKVSERVQDLRARAVALVS